MRRALRVLATVIAAAAAAPSVLSGQELSRSGAGGDGSHSHAPAEHAEGQEGRPVTQDTADHDHAPGDHEKAASQVLPAGIPPVTDADRAAAFPDVRGHTVHDQAVHHFVLFDQIEWRDGDGGVGWENTGWIGRDVDRVWFRTAGELDGARLDAAGAEVLYGRAIAPWWDVVAGVRQDFRPGPSRTWLAVGLLGLAPYWFEVEATAYLGAGGRTLLKLEAEYELLLTNNLILQPLVEADVAGRSDPDRGVGAGLSTVEAGLRLRYEIRREIAPYAGVLWSRKFFGTAELAEAAGGRAAGAGLVVGLRLWF